jgi:hypothetical protein
MFGDEEIFKSHARVVINPFFHHQINSAIFSKDPAHQLKMFFFLIDCSYVLKTEIANQSRHLLVYLILAHAYVPYGRVN